MGGAFLVLSYYKVWFAVMEQCSYVTGGGIANMWWWGYGGGRKPPKTRQNRVTLTRKHPEYTPKKALDAYQNRVYAQ